MRSNTAGAADAAAGTVATAAAEVAADAAAAASQELPKKMCRICHEHRGGAQMISPCACKGSLQHVHVACLAKWRLTVIKESRDPSRCEMCKAEYNVPLSNRAQCRFKTQHGLYTVGYFALSFLIRTGLHIVVLWFLSCSLSLSAAEQAEGMSQMAGVSAGQNLPLFLIWFSVVAALRIVWHAMGGTEQEAAAVLSVAQERKILQSLLAQNVIGILCLAAGSFVDPAQAFVLQEMWRCCNLVAPLFAPCTLLWCAECDVANRHSGAEAEPSAPRVEVQRTWRNIAMKHVVPIVLAACVLACMFLPLLDAISVRQVSSQSVGHELISWEAYQWGAHSTGHSVHNKLSAMFNVMLSGIYRPAAIVNASADRMPAAPVWSWGDEPTFSFAQEESLGAIHLGATSTIGADYAALVPHLAAGFEWLESSAMARRESAAAALKLRMDQFSSVEPQLQPYRGNFSANWSLGAHGPAQDGMCWWIESTKSAAAVAALHNQVASVVYAEAQRGDTVVLAPGMHFGSVLLHQHLVLRGQSTVAEVAFKVIGGGAECCEGLYTSLGRTFDGVPAYRRVQGTRETLLLRYRVPAGVRYWYLVDAADLHSGRGDYFRVKSGATVPPPAGWSADRCIGTGTPPRVLPIRHQGTCEPGADCDDSKTHIDHLPPPATLVGQPRSSMCGTTLGKPLRGLRWWLNRVVFSESLSASVGFGCSALYVGAAAAIVSHVTLVAAPDLLHQQTTPSGDRQWSNIVHVALEISSGSATIAHVHVIGGVHIHGPRSRPLLEWLVVSHASIGFSVNHHAAPLIRDAVIHSVGTGIDATQGATLNVLRVEVTNVTFSGAVFSAAARARMKWSSIMHAGLTALAVTDSAVIDASSCAIHHAVQTGILLERGAGGTLDRIDVFRAGFAGVELRLGTGSVVVPTLSMSVVRECGTTGLYAHAGGVGSIRNVALLGNRLGAAEIGDGARPSLLDCQMRGGEPLAQLQVMGKGSTPEFRNCDIDASGGESAGSAVIVESEAMPLFYKCNIHGGALSGLVVRGGAAPRLLKCVLHSNGQSGLEIVGHEMTEESSAAPKAAQSPVLEQVEFHSNEAAVFGYRNAHARLRDCTWRESKETQLFRIDGSQSSVGGTHGAAREHGPSQPTMTVVLRDGATLSYH